MTLGIDISHYSGARDWRCLLGTGIAFAYVKASEGGTLEDQVFERHWASLHDAKIPCGAYHFARPGTDPAAQAALFHSVVGDLDAGDLLPVMDLESGDGQQPSQVLEWTLEFLKEAEALLRTRFMIYTGGYWRRTMGDPECAPLGERKLWTARYGSKPPVLPRPWNAWAIWQFSDGIYNPPPEAEALKCHCDWNRLADGVSLASLTVGANSSAPTPAPQPGPASPDAWPGRLFVYPAKPIIQGEDVRKWQGRMLERGWKLDEDGKYGPLSSRACVSLQRTLGLVPDGIVGRKTWQATFAAD